MGPPLVDPHPHPGRVDGGDDRGHEGHGRLTTTEFGAWLGRLADALDGAADMDVPCGSCTACCTSDQFVHIGPDEADTLQRIPPALAFPAPGLPDGHVVLGYDADGRCPMFVDGRCSIYDHRPRSCRTYDCRLFVAADVTPDKPAIAERVRSWSFTYADPAAREQHHALRAAAASLSGPPTGVAVRAVRAVLSNRG